MDFLNNMYEQHQIMAQQQEEMQYQMMLQQQQMMGMKMRKTTRKDILMYLQTRAASNDVVTVDDFETESTRHICRSTKEIKLLTKGIEAVPTSEGVLHVEYFLCPVCRRLILNKNTLDMY